MRRLGRSVSNSPLSSPVYSRSNSGILHERSHTFSVEERSFNGMQEHSRETSSSKNLPDADPEYLKAVVLKFLEAKDKRNQLLPVLGMILKFTPDELARARKKL